MPLGTFHSKVSGIEKTAGHPGASNLVVKCGWVSTQATRYSDDQTPPPRPSLRHPDPWVHPDPWARGLCPLLPPGVWKIAHMEQTHQRYLMNLEPTGIANPIGASFPLAVDQAGDKSRAHATPSTPEAPTTDRWRKVRQVTLDSTSFH